MVLVGSSWETDRTGVSPVAGRCTVTDSAVDVTTEQAGNAATIAAVARGRGLPDRAVVIALATAQQESTLRNLDHGDRDSLGLFQQRPSQGWGSEEQVRDPVYAAGKFYDGLVEVPGWQTGRLTDVAQAVQRSGFPEAYQKWSGMAEALTAALLSDVPGRLSCRFDPTDGGGSLDDRAGDVAAVAGRELSLPVDAGTGGLVQVDGGWPAAKWAIANAARLTLAEVTLDGWRWSPDGGWAPDADSSGAPLELRLSS